MSENGTNPAESRPASGSSTTAQDHWVPVASGHQLHLTELVHPGEDQPPGAIVLLHGVFSDSRFFYNPRKPGDTARFFADKGYRVFLGELRGHGKSRWPEGQADKKRWDWSFDSYAHEDIPALLDFARGAIDPDTPLFVLCHSMSGYALLAGLGCEPGLQHGLAGVVLLGSAVNDYSDGGVKKRLMLPLSRAISRVLGRLPGKRFGMGPADEPAAVMRQFADWAKDGRFESLDRQRDYWASLEAITVPVLAGVGAADVFHASPRRAEKLLARVGSADKTLEIYGRDQGLSRDFGHFDIAAGQAASQEILPRIERWMQQRRSPS